MHHNLKIHPEYLEAKLKGVKPWESRWNDRDFQVGDTVTFREWRPAFQDDPGGYTGREHGPVEITYLLGQSSTVPGGCCIFTHTAGETFNP